MTVNSSLYQIADESFTSSKEKTYNNPSLRVGIVIDIIDIGTKGNINGMVPEYNVTCIEQNGLSGTDIVSYKNCLIMDSFGSQADFFHFTRRLPKNSKKTKTSGTLKNQEGSVVLLLCLDKNSEKAVIIGSLANPSGKTKLTKEKGHCLEGEFNGLSWTVDKEGALTVKFKGKTKITGEAENAELGGSSAAIEKDGSIEVKTKGKQKIRLDQVKKTIDIEAEADISVKTEANLKIDAKEKIEAKAKDMEVTLENNFKVQATGQGELFFQGVIKVQTDTLDIKANNQVKILASSMSVFANKIDLGVGGLPAQTFFTQQLGIGNLGAPVISFAISGFSSVVRIAV